MKYAAEIIDLMSAQPERQFQMRDLVREVCPNALAEVSRKSSLYRTVRIALHRLLEQLVESKSVEVQDAGNHFRYRWRVTSPS